jgi:uncharacterized protein YjbJ (UPF0337 family)
MKKDTSPQSGTSQKWEGRWDQLRGRAKQFWGWLTDDDLTRVEGDYDRLVGFVKEKTGKTKEEIEKQLNS